MALNFEEPEIDALRRIMRELSDKIDDYEAGADFDPSEEGAKLTAAQLWARLLSGGIHDRQRMIHQLMRNTDLARDCSAADHVGLVRSLRWDLEDARAKLSAAFGFEEPQSLSALIVAVQALRNVMVEGIASRGSQDLRIEFQPPTSIGDLLDDFPVEAGVAEKITEQLKTAGIDTQSICGYEWDLTDEHLEHDISTVHRCTKVNPLHADAHGCGNCGTALTHEEAEKLEASK